MATKLSSITRSKYTNKSGDIDINYEVSQNAGESVKEVSASFRRGGILLGSIFKNTERGINASFSSSVTDEEAKSLLNMFISDSTQIFNELTPKKEEA